MKVLSFDVGIKNLAGCIIEWNTDSDDIKSHLNIHYWDIINIVQNKTNNDQKSYKCCNKDCSGKVKSYIDLLGTKYYLCSKHLTKKDELLEHLIKPWNENNWTQIKNCKCNSCDSTEIEIDTKINLRKTYFVNKELNMTLCNKHYKSDINKVTKSYNKLIPLNNKKVKDMTSNDIKFELIKCLDDRKNELLTNAEIVLIENQPSFKNPSMKAISDVLYTWFMIRGIVDKEINNSTIKEIRFISPSNKLKEFDTKKLDEADDTKKYKITKKLSIDNTKTILTSYELDKWTERILSFDKKDDLADCFLQGWYVLNNMFNEQLYNDWQELYKSKVINVSSEVEIKTKEKKKKIIKKEDINIDIEIPQILDLRDENNVSKKKISIKDKLIKNKSKEDKSIKKVKKVLKK